MAETVTEHPSDPTIAEHIAMEIDRQDNGVAIPAVLGVAAAYGAYKLVDVNYPNAAEYRQINSKVHFNEDAAANIVRTKELLEKPVSVEQTKNLDSSIQIYQRQAQEAKQALPPYHPNLETAATTTSAFITLALVGGGAYAGLRRLAKSGYKKIS